MSTYKSKMTARIVWSVNGGDEHEEVRELGQLPIMVKVRSPAPNTALSKGRA